MALRIRNDLPTPGVPAVDHASDQVEAAEREAGQTVGMASIDRPGGAARAQPLNEAVDGLETCFKQARIADSICAKGELNAAQRLNCFQKARDVQLECLDHVQQAMMAGSKPPQQPSTAASPESPATMPSRAPPGTGSAAVDVARGSSTRTRAEQPDSATGVTVQARQQDSAIRKKIGSACKWATATSP